MPSQMRDIILSKLRNEPIGYIAENHTPQPFNDINVKDKRYATLSWGLFDENPQPKPIERYGKTLFNTKTKKIVEFKEPDSTFFNYPIDPVVFAWGIDPLAAKYPNLSPYVAFNNNPIIYIDPNGKAYIPVNEGAKTVIETASNRFGQDLLILYDEKTNTYSSKATIGEEPGYTFQDESDFRTKLQASNANYTNAEINEAWSFYQGLSTPVVYELEITITKEGDASVYSNNSSANGSTNDNKSSLQTDNDEYEKFIGILGKHELSKELADAIYNGKEVKTTDNNGNEKKETIKPNKRGKGWAFFENKSFKSGLSKLKGVILIDATNNNSNQIFNKIIDATKKNLSVPAEK